MIALPNPLWSLQGVVFRHANACGSTLADVTVDFAVGQFTSLLGPNGTGKSTLLQLLLGLLRPARGAVMFDGRAVSQYSRIQLARQIAVVPQTETDAAFTVQDVVAMGRYPHLGQWQRARKADTDAMEHAMRRLDVAQFADRLMSTLSGGERQRVRLARALAQEARVLVLDEPTASLDIGHEMATFQLLRQLCDEGVTVLLATHNLNLAARFSDRLVLLHDGRVSASGTPSDVLTAARVGEAYEWPVEVTTHTAGRPQVVPV